MAVKKRKKPDGVLGHGKHEQHGSGNGLFENKRGSGSNCVATGRAATLLEPRHPVGRCNPANAVIKIIQEFPREIKPHADLIDIAVRWLDDGDLAEKLFQRGMSLLTDPADRERLSDAYERSRSRLKTHEAPKTISAEKLNEVKARLERNRRELWR